MNAPIPSRAARAITTLLGTLIVSAVLCMSGCAYNLTGPVFQAPSQQPAQAAILHIYWTEPPLRFEESLLDSISFDLKVNGRAIAEMKHRGYISIVVPQGPQGRVDLETSLNFRYGRVGALDMADSPNQKLTLNVGPGMSYYIPCFVGAVRLGVYYLVMREVDESTGLAGLRGSRLLPLQGIR